LLLEWHYVVDILGGVLVAALAVAAVDGRELLQAAGIIRRSEGMTSPS
jgi:membrane-associated phospholipid phosphatase